MPNWQVHSDPFRALARNRNRMRRVANGAVSRDQRVIFSSMSKMTRTNHDGGGTSHAAGVSLLEILAALFVFSIGLLGSLKMYDVMLDKVRAMRENDIAVCALQNEMETLRAMPFEALAERTGAPFVSHTPDIEQLVQVLPTVDVRPYGQPALALKEVHISVRWRGDNGRVIEKTLSTLIGKKEAGPS